MLKVMPGFGKEQQYEKGMQEPAGGIHSP